MKTKEIPRWIFLTVFSIILSPSFIKGEVVWVVRKLLAGINKFSIPTLLCVDVVSFFISLPLIGLFFDHHYEVGELPISIIALTSAIVISSALLIRRRRDWSGDWFCKTDQ